jgi:hypothetical protein
LVGVADAPNLFRSNHGLHAIRGRRPHAHLPQRSSPATPGTNWWWLEVTGENQRYAAFRTEPTDTPENLNRASSRTTRISSPSARVRGVPPALVGRPKAAACTSGRFRTLIAPAVRDNRKA